MRHSETLSGHNEPPPLLPGEEESLLESSDAPYTSRLKKLGETIALIELLVGTHESTKTSMNKVEVQKIFTKFKQASIELLELLDLVEAEMTKYKDQAVFERYKNNYFDLTAYKERLNAIQKLLEKYGSAYGFDL